MSSLRISTMLGVDFILDLCGSGLSGEYTDEMGLTHYQFEPDGRVFVSVLGTTSAGQYELDGDRVLLTGPQGTLVLTRRGENLEGPMGLKLIKSRKPDPEAAAQE